MKEFAHSFAVLSEAIDYQGHVNNVVYLQWIQDVALAHWNSDAPEDIRKRYGWWVSRHEIDYKRPAFAGENITAKTWVGGWKGVTCDRYTEITREGELLVKSVTVWVFIDRETTKPTRITSEVKEPFV